MGSYRTNPRTTSRKSKAARRPRQEPIQREATLALPADIQLTRLCLSSLMTCVTI